MARATLTLCGILPFVLLPLFGSGAENPSRWTVRRDGLGIAWDVAGDVNPAHSDCIEMSGLMVSVDCGFAVSADRTLTLSRKVFWPSFRKQPNDTYGTLSGDFDNLTVPGLLVNGKRIVEKVESISFDGVLAVDTQSDGVRINRVVFPSVDKPTVYEILTVTNTSGKDINLTVATPVVRYALGCDGRYAIRAIARVGGSGPVNPGKSETVQVEIQACRVDRPESPHDGLKALSVRRRRITVICDNCVLVTGMPILDTMFRLAKLHAAENIFATRGGLMHSPGGGHYYAGTWCNDQIEYAGPWFAYTGDETSLQASYNAYCQYLPFMADDYAPIPSSVIAEGFDYWNGAGDRGDAAMWAYGATRFVLSSGRKDWGERLLPGIRWTLEYCRRRLNGCGVVLSDTDELEGRLPSGSANLCTSSLYYDALVHAAILMRELGYATEAADCENKARQLRKGINAYFAATVHGYETYRYYEGCDKLRSWIGIPLCMGIDERAEGTANALLSEQLWCGDGMLSAEGDSRHVTWDRSALYAFRGMFACGKTDLALPALLSYSASRLTGQHVPYPVEAWPEGGRRQLSAESALYCRIFTEGIFGMDPTGFGKFAVNPHIPEGWERMEMRNVRSNGRTFSIEVTAKGFVVKEDQR